MRTKLVVNIIVLVFLQACATVDRGQRVVGERSADLASPAAMLEKTSQNAEEKLRRSGSRITDMELESYVQTITDEIVGDFTGEIRAYILQAPVFNAFMMPNGAMGVNSGLLLRVETQDELVAVLGHEFAHYLEKHSEERHVQVSNTNTAIKLITLAGFAATTATDTHVDTSTITLAMVAGAFSFSRQQELEADRIGIEIVGQHGYSPENAVSMWENLDAEKKASSIRAVRGRHSSIYDTHPTSEARLKQLRKVAGIGGGVVRSSVEARSAYRAKIRPFLLSWLEDEIALRDPGATLAILDRLDALDEDNGVLLYARARVIDRALTNSKLKKDKATRKFIETFPKDAVVKTLAESVSYPDAPAVAYRAYGNELFKQGDNLSAQKAFNRYLEIAPNAQDILLVKSMLQQIEGSS